MLERFLLGEARAYRRERARFLADFPLFLLGSFPTGGEGGYTDCGWLFSIGGAKNGVGEIGFVGSD